MLVEIDASRRRGMEVQSLQRQKIKRKEVSAT